jgi:hypothetical protein
MRRAQRPKARGTPEPRIGVYRSIAKALLKVAIRFADKTARASTVQEALLTTSNPRWFYNLSTQTWVNHL